MSRRKIATQEWGELLSEPEAEQTPQITLHIDSELLDDDTPNKPVADELIEQPSSEHMILYEKHIDLADNKFLTISHNDIDKYNFREGFNEFITDQQYLRLFCDIDDIVPKNEKNDGVELSFDDKIARVDEVFNYLDSLKSVFGEYTYGGYSIDKRVAEKYNLRLFADDPDKHFISMHAVYYQTCLSKSDIIDIFQYRNGQYLTEGVSKYFDPEVYKIQKRRAFRHVLSDKIFTSSTRNTKLNHADYINDSLLGPKLGVPSNAVVQINGLERVVEKSEWEKLFKLPVKDDKQTTRIKKVLSKNGCKNIDVEAVKNGDYGIEYNEELVVLSDDELLRLLNNFDSTFTNLSSICSNLIHSHFDKEYLRSILSQWYFRIEHTNTSSLDNFLDKYYEQTEPSNKWFRSIIKHIENEDVRKAWYNDYLKNAVDDNIHVQTLLEKDPFTISDLDTNISKYSLKGGVGINVVKFLNDLKRVLVVINGANRAYLVKERDTKYNAKLVMMSEKKFLARLSRVNVGKYWNNGTLKTATAAAIYLAGDNKKWFLYDRLKFSSKQESVYSLFSGYPYKILDEADEDVIKPFLEHTREVICNNDETLYNYTLDWISFVIQNHKKTKHALVLLSHAGSGKNWWSDCICKIIGQSYTNRDLTNIDHLTGRFNTERLNKKLIVVNELSDAEGNKQLNLSCMKAVIDNETFTMEGKGADPINCNAVDNYIICSNERGCLKIDWDDRRYVVYEVNDKYRKNEDYFKHLLSIRTRKFYENLLTYFIKREIKCNVQKYYPDTKLRREIQKESEPASVKFIRENVEMFKSKSGCICSEAYQRYKEYCITNGYKPGSDCTFGKQVKDYLDKKRPRASGSDKRPFRYFLKPDVNFDDDDDDDNELPSDFDENSDIDL